MLMATPEEEVPTPKTKSKKEAPAPAAEASPPPIRESNDDFLSRLETVEKVTSSGNGSSMLPLLAAARTPPKSGSPAGTDSQAAAASSSTAPADSAVSSRMAVASSSSNGASGSADADLSDSDAEESPTKGKKGKAAKSKDKDKDGKKAVPRHRRVHKRAGSTLGLTLMDHPRGGVVVVKALAEDGECARQGMQVGEIISKINGTKVDNHRDAMRLAEAAWIEPTDGSKEKDKIKFALADRIRLISVVATAPVLLDERGRPQGGAREDIGLTLIDNGTAGLGVVVLHVLEGKAAARGGLEVGHIIQSVNGQLVYDHKMALARIMDSVATTGKAQLVCLFRKLTESNLVNERRPADQRVGELPVAIIAS